MLYYDHLFYHHMGSIAETNGMEQIYIGQQFGNYKLVRLLGDGGFTPVYLGEHVHSRTYATVKLLKWQTPQEFMNEAFRIFHLQHANILRILDFGIKKPDDTAYIIMEYAPNVSFRDKFPRGTRVPLNVVISTVKQVAAALQYAHDQRVIHLDVKPENLLLNEQNMILLSDFSIDTAKDSLGGTLAYMAPEQINGHPVPASDQYSLATMVYEWLCGKLPFEGNVIQMSYLHAYEPPPPLREHIPSLSPAVEQVVLRALAKKPEERFERVAMFALALEQAARGQDAPSVRNTPQPAFQAAQYDATVQSPTPPSSLEQLFQASVRSQASGNVKDVDILLSAYLPPNTILRTRYHILEQLGKGGMGAVYKAKDATFSNRFLAVKQMTQSGLPPQMLAVYTNNFQREANLLASLMHPNLPRIYEYFSEGAYWYLVMDYIEGINLQKHLEQSGGRLSIEEALRIGIDLCTVLHYLHTRQPTIIFRDLKPANVMLTSEGHLYLIDFGIARQFNPTQQQDTHNFQTPGYAAPEQFNQKQTTPQSDIYSLGATLHQLLSGADPTDNIFDLPPLHVGVPELTALVTTMLEMKPIKRPATMLVVKQELQRILTQIQSGVKPAPSLPWQPVWQPVPVAAPVKQGVAYLRIVEGREVGKSYELRKESTSIGRSSECDVFLVDLAVSRLHATISKNSNGYIIKDEGTANGTKINGQLINKYSIYSLQEGDKIGIGQTIFVFTYQN